MTVAGDPVRVALSDLAVGPVLAEGGEGRVHGLDGRPGTLLKRYRSPVAADHLRQLVAWPSRAAAVGAALAARVTASAAWPSAVVAADGDPERAAGILMPRAPRRFSLRHRDGTVRLATLSYLTSPPGQRIAAYGLALPARFSPERIGLVYALARLLEAFQAATPAVGHGDLSARNVLWSLERGPEVFLLDCDSAALGDEAGADRRRAMTPNWDDPAVVAGGNPTPASDRYSLALTFLRVTGAAHFPLQGRQRTGDPLHVEVGVPPPAAAAPSLDADAAVWDLCARSLSRDHPEERPGAGAWVAALEQVLDDLGAMRTVRAVWAAQGGGVPGPTPARARPWEAADVSVVPVAAASGEARWTRITPTPQPAPGSAPAGRRGRPGRAPTAAPSAAAVAAAVRATPAGGYRRAGAPAGAGSAVAVPLPPLGVVLRSTAARGGRAWLALHRRMLRALTTPGRRSQGVARLAGCAAVDLAGLVVVVFGVAMLFAPLLSI